MDFTRKIHAPGAKISRSVYTGWFACPGKALDLLHFSQASVTKLARKDEFGNDEWGETITTFRLIDKEISFDSLDELITFYNNKTKMKDVRIKNITFSISECGTVVLVNGERKPIHPHKLPKQRLLRQVNAGNRTWNVRRLTALAWLEEPSDKNMRVLLEDGDENNTHFTNLFWSKGSHTPEEAAENVKHLNN